MAFNQQQAKRAQAVVVIALLVVVIALAAVVLSGALSPKASADASAADTGSTAQQAQQEAAGDNAATSTGSSSMQIDSMDDVNAYYGAAIASLQTTYEQDSSNPAALLNLANGYFDWGSAAMQYVEEDADSEHVSDLFNHAIELYDQYLEQNPQSNSVIVDRAISMFYTGDHAQAISELEAFTQENGTYAAGWANLGVFYEADGQTDKAKEAYQKAVDTATDSTVKEYAQSHLDSLNE